MPDQNKDNKTEKASPHRRMEARKKGNVFQSKDLVSGVMVLVSFLALRLLIGYMFGMFENVLVDFAALAGSTEKLTETGAANLIFDLALNIALMAMPILLVAMILGVAMSVSQTRFIFTFEQVKPKLSKLNPLSGLKKMFSLKSLVELVKSMMKISVIIFIVYVVLSDKINQLPMLIMADIKADVLWMLTTMFDVALFAGIGMIAIGILDYIWQWWEYERSLRMSKQEIKDEYKQLEGDPLIKSRIRSIREKKARERMMAGVKDADVVIRNPDHFAVALQYDINKNAAPLVIAKGQDYLALQIIKEAQKYNIMAVHNPVLARVLYATVDIGSEVENIPEEFMFALADIVFALYESRNKLQDIKNFAGNNKLNQGYK